MANIDKTIVAYVARKMSVSDKHILDRIRNLKAAFCPPEPSTGVITRLDAMIISKLHSSPTIIASLGDEGSPLESMNRESLAFLVEHLVSYTKAVNALPPSTRAILRFVESDICIGCFHPGPWVDEGVPRRREEVLAAVQGAFKHLLLSLGSQEKVPDDPIVTARDVLRFVTNVLYVWTATANMRLSSGDANVSCFDVMEEFGGEQQQPAPTTATTEEPTTEKKKSDEKNESNEKGEDGGEESGGSDSGGDSASSSSEKGDGDDTKDDGSSSSFSSDEDSEEDAPFHFVEQYVNSLYKLYVFPFWDDGDELITRNVKRVRDIGNALYTTFVNMESKFKASPISTRVADDQKRQAERSEP